MRKRAVSCAFHGAVAIEATIYHSSNTYCVISFTATAIKIAWNDKTTEQQDLLIWGKYYFIDLGLGYCQHKPGARRIRQTPSPLSSFHKILLV